MLNKKHYDELQKLKEEEVENNREIIGIECWKCKQVPFGSDDKKHWPKYIYGKCGYCDEENAIHFKWGTKQEEI